MHYPTPRLIDDDNRRHSASSLSGYAPSPATEDARRFEPYRRLHRLLRGRYHMVVPLVAIALIAGAVKGWRSQAPLYRSEGLIHVANSLPAVMNSTDQNEPMQMFDEFVESQVLLMGSQHVVAMAMENPQFQQSLGSQPMSLDTFASELVIEHPPRTQAIHVTFTWRDPNVAAHAVKAVIGAFVESYGMNDGAEEDHRLAILVDRKSALTDQISSLKASMGNIAAPSATSIAMVDDLMRDMLRQEAALQGQVYAYDVAGWGDSRPQVVSTRKRLAETQKSVESYRAEVTSMQIATACSAPQDRRVPLLAPFLPYARQMDELIAQLDETNHRMDVLHTEASLGAGRFRVLSDGELPSVPYADRRVRMALIDGAGAACVPLFVFFLMGFFDRRVRFSEDAQHREGTVPLLGVLPSLPNGPLYPELARIAAFCVHNLRIRLQLLATEGKSAVYMITSAAAGEGKTSLTLSLGLSFASAGKRVLMIDCDPIGRGLSQRLKCNTSRGLSEHLAGANLEIATKISQNLTLLPAGVRNRPTIETEFSADRLRVLINEARGKFDVVLVDTGPVLSSLQNPVIAQFCDFVILTIAQGQQQPLVERSQRMLQSVGIRISGFVFNRASAGDYRRWVGGTTYYDSVVGRAFSRKAIAREESEPVLGALANTVAAEHFSTMDGKGQ